MKLAIIKDNIRVDVKNMANIISLLSEIKTLSQYQ